MKKTLFFIIMLLFFISTATVDGTVCSNPAKFYQQIFCSQWCQRVLLAQRGGACVGGVCTCWR